MNTLDKPKLCRLFFNIPFVISGCALFSLTATSLFNAAVAALFMLCTAVASLYLENVYPYSRKHLSLKNSLISLCVQGFMALEFYNGMVNSSKLTAIAGKLGITVEMLVLLAVLCAIICSFYFCSTVLSACTALCTASDQTECDTRLAKYLSSDRFVRLLRFLLAACFLNVIACCFSASIWVDEAFTLGLIKHNLVEVVQLTALDVHPPLYYLLLKLFEDALSVFSTELTFKIIVAKLFSVLAYILTAVLCWTKLRKVETKGFRELLLLSMFATSIALRYSIEIRMYGWALLFVTGSYLYAKDIMDGVSTPKSWGLLVIFSLCSAYTHNFALISMAAVWLYLLIWLLLYNRKTLKLWFCCGVLTGLGYFPWFLVLMRQTSAVSESYWISAITLSTVASYITCLFPHISIFVPVTIFLFLSKQSNRKKLFYHSIAGLIPATTLGIGLAISFALRPIFVIRYLVPCMICLWTTILICWCKMASKLKAAVAALLVFSCILYGGFFASQEFIQSRQASQVMSLVNAMEDDAIFYAETNGDSHVYQTVAGYTDNPVYASDIADDVANNADYAELIQHIYPNLQDGDASVIDAALENGQVVYYITYDTELDSSPWDTLADTSLLGTYLFERNVQVYRLTPIATK